MEAVVIKGDICIGIDIDEDAGVAVAVRLNNDGTAEEIGTVRWSEAERKRWQSQ